MENVSFFEARKQVIKQSYAEAVSRSGQQQSSQAADQVQQQSQRTQILGRQNERIEKEQIEKVASEIVQSCTTPEILKKLIEFLMKALHVQVNQHTQNGSPSGE